MPADLNSAAPELHARYCALIRITEGVRGNRDPRELFQLLLSELRAVVPFDVIAQYDESEKTLLWNTCEDGMQSRVEHAPEWWDFEDRRPVLIVDIDHEMRPGPMLSTLKSWGIESLVAVPLITAQRQLGSLTIASRTVNSYCDDHLIFLSVVGSQIALAMNDILNEEALRSARDRLRLLLDITNRITTNLNLDALLKEVSSTLREVMDCAGVGVVLPDGEGGLKLRTFDFPESRGFISTEVEIVKGSIFEEVMRSGKPLMVEPEARDPIASLEGLRLYLHLPLPGKQDALGVLSLARREDKPFTDDDITFLVQVAHQIAIALANAMSYKEVAVLKEQLAQQNLYLEDEIRSELRFEEIIGKSPALTGFLSQVATVAPTDSTVLIYGETGTGKELIARALHNLSSRRSNAFVKLNCAAIPTGLLESELFGHERGAFTGAISQRVGRFELAHRGTVFLDEIGEVPLELQPKLLRVLQEREFERLGSTRTLKSDARLIAATNRDLSAMVDEQKFRADLFYRLNVFPLYLPPLRERCEDIPLLVRHFVQQFSLRSGKNIDTIASETMNGLVRYPWPGNIRELQNVIERAVILSPGPMLKVSLTDLKGSPPKAKSKSAPEETAAAASNIQDVLEETERKQILKALEASKGVISGPEGAAGRLGLKRSTLQHRMQKLGIRVARDIVK
jgi:formate hydrogenlyase transcriptional activator